MVGPSLEPSAVEPSAWSSVWGGSGARVDRGRHRLRPAKETARCIRQRGSGLALRPRTPRRPQPWPLLRGTNAGRDDHHAGPRNFAIRAAAAAAVPRRRGCGGRRGLMGREADRHARLGGTVDAAFTRHGSWTSSTCASPATVASVASSRIAPRRSGFSPETDHPLRGRVQS
jgi:hypothetical protein